MSYVNLMRHSATRHANRWKEEKLEAILSTTSTTRH